MASKQIESLRDAIQEALWQAFLAGARAIPPIDVIDSGGSPFVPDVRDGFEAWLKERGIDD